MKADCINCKFFEFHDEEERMDGYCFKGMYEKFPYKAFIECDYFEERKEELK